jgi:hypothetical protein
VLVEVSPNLLLPDEYIIEDDTMFTFSCSAVIVPLTTKSLPTFTEPVMVAEPDSVKSVLPTNPLLGDITN